MFLLGDYYSWKRKNIEIVKRISSGQFQVWKLWLNDILNDFTNDVDYAR